MIDLYVYINHLNLAMLLLRTLHGLGVGAPTTSSRRSRLLLPRLSPLLGADLDRRVGSREKAARQDRLDGPRVADAVREIDGVLYYKVAARISAGHTVSRHRASRTRRNYRGLVNVQGVAVQVQQFPLGALNSTT